MNEQIFLEGLTQFTKLCVEFRTSPPAGKMRLYLFAYESFTRALAASIPGDIGRCSRWCIHHNKWANDADKSRLITLRPLVVHLINNMAASGGDQSAIQKIKLNLKISSSSLENRDGWVSGPISDVKFRFTQLE